MTRPFTIIPYRPYRSDTQSALGAMRIETEEDEVKAKKIKSIIKKARKLDLSAETINALRSEYNPYFYLHMTQAELYQLQEKFRLVGLYACWPSISEYGVNFTGSNQYVIADVADPVEALQSALDSIKETVLFTGTVEIEYQDTNEIKFLDVRKSVVTMVDEFPR